MSQELKGNRTVFSIVPVRYSACVSETRSAARGGYESSKYLILMLEISNFDVIFNFSAYNSKSYTLKRRLTLAQIICSSQFCRLLFGNIANGIASKYFFA